MNWSAWIVFIAAAVLEVGGDALLRKGLRGSGFLAIAAGFLVLGSYGLVVNMVRWDFSKLLGVYVAVFAAVSVLFGRFVFGEAIPVTTWIGLAAIVARALQRALGARAYADHSPSFGLAVVLGLRPGYRGSQSQCIEQGPEPLGS